MLLSFGEIHLFHEMIRLLRACHFGIADLGAPPVKAYLIAAHCSEEMGHRVILEHLGLRPLLDLQMCLGEGTGAVLAMPIVDAAAKLLNEMATFDEAGVSKQ